MIWFLCLTANQILLGYLMPKFYSFECNYNFVFNVQLY